jgi:hypothetical protein
MNTQVLVKCLDELTKDKPNIEYVKGMLETLITLSGAPSLVFPTISSDMKVHEKVKEVLRTETMSDEEINLSKYAGGNTGTVRSY